jgi:hypothetical protein
MLALQFLQRIEQNSHSDETINHFRTQFNIEETTSPSEIAALCGPSMEENSCFVVPVAPLPFSSRKKVQLSGESTKLIQPASVDITAKSKLRKAKRKKCNRQQKENSAYTDFSLATKRRKKEEPLLLTEHQEEVLLQQKQRRGELGLYTGLDQSSQDFGSAVSAKQMSPIHPLDNTCQCVHNTQPSSSCPTSAVCGTWSLALSHLKRAQEKDKQELFNMSTQQLLGAQQLLSRSLADLGEVLQQRFLLSNRTEQA